MKSQIASLLSIFLVAFSLGCESTNSNSYLDHFETVQPKLVEFDTENLPETIKSPFDGVENYPTGKIPLANGDFITLITIYDGEEPFGEVHAELISGGERQDMITVAVADLGYHSYSDFELPRIVVIENYEDRKYDSIVYRVKQEGFELVE